MLEYKILIKLFVLNCEFVCCIYVVPSSKRRWWRCVCWSRCTTTPSYIHHTNSQFSTNLLLMLYILTNTLNLYLKH